jgi:hypothetical protein
MEEPAICADGDHCVLNIRHFILRNTMTGQERKRENHGRLGRWQNR